MSDYAELHVISNYSFLRGASDPAELVARADDLGYRAIAITDECSLSGMVRAWAEARERAIQLIVGSSFNLGGGLHLVLLAADRTGYGNLCRLITRARRQAQKGQYHLGLEDFKGLALDGCLAIWLTHTLSTPEQGKALAPLFPGRLWIGVHLERSGRDRVLLAHSDALARALGLPRTACGNVLMHHPGRRPLRDVLTAIRLGRPLTELGHDLPPNAEQYLRPRSHLVQLYPAELLAQSVAIARRCMFDPGTLRYEYPDDLTPPGMSDGEWLQQLTREGMARRWPQGVPNKVQNQIDNELELIGELHYEPYFLTVYDLVRFAREQGILCQGRGSAANSAVCYCLGITEVNPANVDLLFERFISRERNEPPDIDVDFEHERREEVIQYIYRRYGRHRAALAATVITYRARSAIRDVGKAIGMSLDQVTRIAKSVQHWDKPEVLDERLRDSGFDPGNPRIRLLLRLVEQIIGFPRHLSQHVGGFIIARRELAELVPIENASMADRTVIQWEKDDLEALGLLKVDVLALGMLTAIRKAFDYIRDYRGESLTMAGIQNRGEDPAVYGMIQRADTVGVFQIESRAQMSMLPRLRPANYYDLVIEIAIVRPGPIQGDMVHPYLRNRNNPDQVSYPSEALREVLKRTLGVPIFQEQVMKIAMVAAGFTPGEADSLRRAMAAWKRRGGLEQFEGKLIGGMLARGYTREFAEPVFNQVKGFGDDGFPESHSASFALLAYVSSWLKHYEPAAFCCGLLNSQPMGFYRPAQLVNDAIRHGVEVRPVDINESHWDCHLEPGRAAEGRATNGQRTPALRLGLRMVKGLSESAGRHLVTVRSNARFQSVQDLTQRTGLDKKALGALAAADALVALSGHRHRASWEVAGVEEPVETLGVAEFNEATPMLPKPARWQNTVADYASTGLTLGEHPLFQLRKTLSARGMVTANTLPEIPSGKRATVAGLVINRQRPGTASGVMFATLEDETGYANIVIWPKLVEKQRRVLLTTRLLIVHGKVQTESGVTHLIADRLADGSDMVTDLVTRSRDFH